MHRSSDALLEKKWILGMAEVKKHSTEMQTLKVIEDRRGGKRQHSGLLALVWLELDSG